MPKRFHALSAFLVRFCVPIAMVIAGGLPGVAVAQGFPAKPLRIVCPFPPGGGADIVARAIANELAAQLGQPVTVENRAGAGGNIAAAEVARAAPDGHSLLLTLNAIHSISPAIYAKLPYDAVKDFAFITPLVTFHNALVTRAAAPADNTQALIASAKAQPGRLTFASSGNGTNLHLIGELFKMRAGIELVHVPYKGSAPAMTDLIGGQVDLMFEVIPTAFPHVKSGKVKALAVTGPRRSRLLPEVPTVAEAGLPGFAAEAWYGLVAPAATPAEVVARLNAEAVKSAQGKAFRERVEALGFDVVTGTPAQMLEMVRADAARWAPVIKTAGIRID